MMDPGPNDPVTPELLRQWNPGGPPRGMELDPAYSDRYLLDEGSQDTLGNLIQTLQGASNRAENIDAGLGRLQGLQEEQRANLQPLWDLGQTASGPGLLDQLRDGLGSVGGALSNGLDAITPSQGTIDNLAMRLQNAHAIGTGRAPLWMQQQEHQMQLSQQQELMQMRRAQAAQQLQQQQMMKQQKDEDQALGIWKDHQMPIAMKKKLSQQLAAQGNVLAGNLHRLGDEQLVAEMDSLAQYLPKGKMEELTQLMKTPNADLEHVERWVNFAREKKKVIGDRQMKSERFADLLGRYNAGEIDPAHPDYDEFKQSILEREKAQQENTEMRMKLEQMGLTKKKAEQELQINSLMPQVSEEIPMAGGKTGKYVVDPQTMQRQLMTGEKKPLVEVNTKQETAEAAAVGKALGEQFNSTQTSASAAQTKLTKLARMEQLLEGVKTGGLVPTFTQLENIAETFGIKVNKNLGARQAFTALASEVALTLRSTGEGAGMPGQLSNQDREFLVGMTPNLAQTPEGNKLIIETAKKLAKREIEIGKLARDYRKKHGSLDPGFYDEAQQYADANPLFEKGTSTSPGNMKSIQLSKEEFDFATQLKKQGMSKEQVLQEIQKRRGR